MKHNCLDLLFSEIVIFGHEKISPLSNALQIFFNRFFMKICLWGGRNLILPSLIFVNTMKKSCYFLLNYMI